MKPTDFRNRLQNGKPLLGGWFQTGSCEILEIMARSGFDWIGMDFEHGTVSLGQLPHYLRAFRGTDCIPFVRLADNHPTAIKRALDLGASAFILPMIQSESAVQQALSALKYPPEGTRGIGFSRANDYGKKFKEMFQSANEDLLVVVQIEGAEAVEQADAIFSQSGIHAYMIGAYDLSGSLGKVGEFQDPEFLAALEKVQTAAKKKSIPAGIHVAVSDMEKVQQATQDGYQFIAYSTDAQLFSDQLNVKFLEWKK